MDGARPSQDMDVLPRGKRPPADRARRPTGPLRLAENLVVVAATIGTTRHRHVIPGDDRSRRGAGYNYGNSRPVPEMRSEEQTSELQSLMRNSYAVFCFKKKR